MRVLVMTVVHHPEDARILHRQIRALTDSGHDVTYAAPFRAVGVAPRRTVTWVDLPRAAGRHRSAALRTVRLVYRRLRPGADLVLLHDPELLLAVAGRGSRAGGPPIVWDVHEDTAAALRMKAWLPAPIRPVAAAAVRLAETAAERAVHLILAEEGYAERFGRHHPVVPNETLVPATVLAPGADRVVHLGTLSSARGTAELVAVAHLMHRQGIRLELMGTADAASRPALHAAVAAGVLDWTGFVPNDLAVTRLQGALAGLCLLHDEPNYRHSMPTKVLEYIAHGLPVITTPNPLAARLEQQHRCGTVVPHGDAEAVARAVLRLRYDEATRLEFARRGHAAARAFHDWRLSGARFVAQLETWAGAAATTRRHATVPAPAPAPARAGAGASVRPAG